jgi:hypothetical protein
MVIEAEQKEYDWDDKDEENYVLSKDSRLP